MAGSFTLRKPQRISRRLTAKVFALLAVFVFSMFSPAFGEFVASGELEIHYINVGQGGCTLIIGPDGTRILYDFGKVAGQRDIVPYLRDVVGLAPQDGLQYTVVSHGDKDHYMGYSDVVEAGYDVSTANYGSGSLKTDTTIIQNWLKPAKKTTAGAVQAIPVGMHIPLGQGAEAVVMAANGVIYGVEVPVPVRDENDRSVVIFIHYGDFQYILDGDLGAGPEACTDHQTGQMDVETHVAFALIQQGLMDSRFGVDVLHIAHHGSESSTSAAYYNLMKPEVGLIIVGLDQGTFLHPREDVVDKVLLPGNRAECVKAPPLKALFQTEDGIKGCSSTGCTSFSGRSVGDIKLKTDGKTGYTISGSNRVHGGSAKAIPPDNVWRFELDERAAPNN
jgi:beta-lactamase superfamily II metal-dependent hydrolase